MWHLCVFSGLDISLTPPSLVVPLRTLATFTCEGPGDQLKWIVQSTELTNAIKQQRDITTCNSNVSSQTGNLSSVLSVNALPINDGLNIGCQIISLSPFKQVFSNTSTLTIEGL